MKKILHITASINGDNSFSTQLSKAILEKLDATYPGSTVKTIDLAQTAFPHIEGFQIGSFFTPEDLRTSEQKQAVAYSDQAVNDLLEADIVVIGLPLYNLNVPSNLKSWIDHVVRAGVTFQYIDGAPQGMVQGKKVYLAIASGNVFSEGPFQPLDFSEPYLKTILGFIGMNDITTFRVEGLARAEYKETAVPKAMAAVQAHAFA
jgi:FMN-dependent NADH-azoreductase